MKKNKRLLRILIIMKRISNKRRKIKEKFNIKMKMTKKNKKRINKFKNRSKIN